MPRTHKPTPPAYPWPVDRWEPLRLAVTQLYGAAVTVQQELSRWPLTNAPMELLSARVYAEVAVDNGGSIIRTLNRFLRADNRRRPADAQLTLFPEPSNDRT
jgi:hypothetical protein